MMLLRWNFIFTLAHCGLTYSGNDFPLNATDNCPFVFKTFKEKKTKLLYKDIGNSSYEIQGT